MPTPSPPSRASSSRPSGCRPPASAPTPSASPTPSPCSTRASPASRRPDQPPALGVPALDGASAGWAGGAVGVLVVDGVVGLVGGGAVGVSGFNVAAQVGPGVAAGA